MKTTHTNSELEPLRWIVVSPEGKLLAALNSESEARFYTLNRGHANGASVVKVDCDYGSAPELLQALEDLVCLCEAGLDREYNVEDELSDARAAIAKATGKAVPKTVPPQPA